MNAINVTVELCAEDRARLDRIYEALTNAGTPFPASVETQEGTDAPAPVTTAPETEKPAEPQETAKTEPQEQPVQKADVQKKVVELSAAGKKADVRAIVKEYAERVTDIPEDKLAEVWSRLTALEG